MRFNKHYAIAKITDPSEVTTVVSARNGKYVNGLIIVDCPELDLYNIPCRYGMSVPYMFVPEEAAIWIEPSIEDECGAERWIYTGFADCGNSDNAPASAMMGKIKLPAGTFTIDINGLMLIIDSVNNLIKLGSESSTESFVLGDSFKTQFDYDIAAMAELQSVLSEWTPVYEGDLKTALANFFAMTMASSTSILSERIKGE